MNRWWRAYDTSKDDPKLLLLPSDTLRWQWYVLMCVASQNGGEIPSLEVAAVGLRLPTNKAAQVIAALHRAGLLDEREDGYFEPHNWKGRQYESDRDPTRNERQQRYRDKKRNALDNGDSNALRNTVVVTRTETETETETEAETKTESIFARNARFEEFWSAYPNRDGANPKEPARKAFVAATKSGVDPRDIIAGARRCAEVDKSKIGTPYIARAVTWLREKRWQDYLETVDPAKQLSMERDMASRGYVWLDGKWQKALEAECFTGSI